jgi:UDP-galactopyranose mutase
MQNRKGIRHTQIKPRHTPTSRTKSYEWLIVGAGFSGVTLAERIATELGQKVLVVDRRNHVGGNAYDEPGENGILVHKYGPHIFHTNSEKVWAYLGRFTEWRPYHHHVLGVVDGKQVPIPFNLNSIYALFPKHMADALSGALIESFGYGKKVPILKLREEKEGYLKFIGDYIYTKVFNGYTRKQWGLAPEELDPSVTARVPINISRDDFYFQDIYQAVPMAGYTVMFKRMLKNNLIDVSLRTNWSDVKGFVRANRVIFTGPIDEYFDYAFGVLPYRSLRFDVRNHDVEYFQAVGTVNYPNEFDFTRITEQKHLTGQKARNTITITEYPEVHEWGRNEPFYPIPMPQTAGMLRPYQAEARRLEGKVWFAGRLGDYAYYNMDQACARALMLFEKTIVPAVRGGS